MTDVSISKLDLLQSRQKATSLLMGNTEEDSSLSDLQEMAAKRNSDKLEFTHLMLKTRLEKDLDSTIATHEAQHPQMKDQYFIAIMEDYTVEVVDKQQFLTNIDDEAAKEQYAKEPVGFFQKEDFPLKTSSDTSYKLFQDKLNQYFQRNAPVIQYLQNNPEGDADLSNLYQPPV